MGKTSEEIRRLSELEVLVLKRRGTSASYKSVVPLTISSFSFSFSFSTSEYPVRRVGKVLGRKRAKPDVGRHRVLRHLILSQI